MTNMRIVNKNDFLKRSVETIAEIFDMLAKLPILQLKDLQSEKTAFVIVDMINGFAREGALKSSRAIVPADAVETYDFGTHNGDLMNAMALYNMMINGIEVVAGAE
jgi:hypothetical protein